jgi:hypothetical protein
VVLIYPVVETKDFVYGHRYGWLDALLQAAEGFMLRPERELGNAFAAPSGSTCSATTASGWTAA